MKFTNMNELIEKVYWWMEERNFFGEDGATLESQELKFFEEFGEYCGNKLRGKCTKDDIGDMMVVCLGLYRIEEKLNMVYSVSVNIDLSIDYFYTKRISSLMYSQHYDYLFYRLSQLSTQEGFTPVECLEHAYNEIKDRKGKWVNGAFIKEADL